MNKQEVATLVDARRKSDPTSTFYYTRVSTKHRYVWVSVQKVASVTIGIALRELDGIPLTDGALWDDEEVPKLQDFTTSEIAEMLTSEEWFRFCFVRNPFDRLLSAYKDKIMRVNAESWYRNVQSEIRERYDYPLRDGERAGRVAFRDFVRFVTEGGHSGDGHWCSQSARLMQDMIPYDFIGHFQTFQKDLEAVLDRLDAPAGVREMASTVRGQSPRINLAVAYDRELAAAVHAWYSEDFGAFGYEKDSWMFDE
jgi:hypothetical protein